LQRHFRTFSQSNDQNKEKRQEKKKGKRKERRKEGEKKKRKEESEKVRALTERFKRRNDALSDCSYFPAKILIIYLTQPKP
jgi:hypothetical protein